MKSLPAHIKNGEIIFNEISKARFIEHNKGKWCDLVVRIPERSISQLRRYRAWLNYVADHTGNDTEELHEFLLDECAPKVVIKIHGPKGVAERTKSKRTSGGHALSMKTREMNEFTEKASALTGYRFLTNKELQDMGYILNT